MGEVLRLNNLYPLESRYLYDISKQEEALKRQWFNKFSDNRAISLPDLNEKMVKKVLIEGLKWKEASFLINTVTKAGPHVTMFIKEGNLNKVIGILRLDNADGKYRLYNEKQFREGFFKSGDYCAIGQDGISSEIYSLIKKRLPMKTVEKIISVAKNSEPAKAFQQIMLLTDAVSFTQFIPTDIKYIIPLINQAALLSYIMGKKFITNIIEVNTVLDAILGIEKVYNKEKIIGMIAKNNNFINRSTGEGNKTIILFFDCLLAFKSTSFVIKNGFNIKAVRAGREKRDDL